MASAVSLVSQAVDSSQQTATTGVSSIQGDGDFPEQSPGSFNHEWQDGEA